MRQGHVVGRLGRWAVCRLDGVLRRRLGIFQYSEDPGCLLRLSFPPTPYEIRLADGTLVAAGEPVANIHLWNERMPPIPPQGADLPWARRFQRGFAHSLRLLAAYLDADPRYASVRAVYGQVGFTTGRDIDTGAGLLRHLGFEMQRLRPQAGPRQRFNEFWQNLYSYGLLWTFNPGSLRGKPFLAIERVDVFMSRAVLRERYGRHERKF